MLRKTRFNRFTEEKRSALNAIIERRRILQDKRKVLEVELSLVKAELADSRVEYGTLYNKDAPLLSLPDEITELIFWFTICSVIKGNGLETRPYFRMGIVVSHVCERWRSVAVNLPCLWTTFSVTTTYSVTTSHLNADRLEAYLKRSKSRLLDLTFNFRSGQSGYSQAEKAWKSVELIRTVIPHSQRWHRLHILGSSIDPQMLHLLKRLRKVSIPNLVHLSICPDSLDSGTQRDDFGNFSVGTLPAITPVIFLGGAPKLSSLFMDQTAPASALPPLANITTIRIDHFQSDSHKVTPFSPRALVELLSIPGLKNLSLFRGSCTTWDALTLLGEAGVQTIVAPQLRQLRVGEFRIMADLIPFLEAPRLERLVLFADSYDTPYIPNPIYIFPALHSLTLDDTDIRNLDSFLHLTQVSPNLTTLSISQRMEPFISDAERWLQDQPAAWPLLRVLKLDTADPSIKEHLKFVEALGNRRYTFPVHEKLIAKWRRDDPAELALLGEKLDLVEQPDDYYRIPAWPMNEERMPKLKHVNDIFNSRRYCGTPGIDSTPDEPLTDDEPTTDDSDEPSSDGELSTNNELSTDDEL